MTDVLMALGFGAALLWGFLWVRVRMADESLDARFQALYREAKRKLPQEDRDRLDAHLIELRGAVIESARLEGWNGKRATREGKAAAIQSIRAFMEIEGLFAPQPKPA